MALTAKQRNHKRVARIKARNVVIEPTSSKKTAKKKAVIEEEVKESKDESYSSEESE